MAAEDDKQHRNPSRSEGVLQFPVSPAMLGRVTAEVAPLKLVRQRLYVTGLDWYRGALDGLSARDKRRPAVREARETFGRALAFFRTDFRFDEEPIVLADVRAAISGLLAVGIGVKRLERAAGASSKGSRRRHQPSGRKNVAASS